MRMAASPKTNAGKIVSSTFTTSQVETKWAVATRRMFRRFSSLKKDKGWLLCGRYYLKA
jgi:hypothetical protein